MERRKGELGDKAWKEFKRLETISNELTRKAVEHMDTAFTLLDWAIQKFRREIYDIWGPYHQLWMLKLRDYKGARVYNDHKEIVASFGDEFNYDRISTRIYDLDDPFAKGSISQVYGEQLEIRAERLLEND